MRPPWRQALVAEKSSCLCLIPHSLPLPLGKREALLLTLPLSPGLPGSQEGVDEWGSAVSCGRAGPSAGICSRGCCSAPVPGTLSVAATGAGWVAV